MHLTADATVDQEDDIQDPSLTKKVMILWPSKYFFRNFFKAQTQPEKTKNSPPVTKKTKRKNEEENHDADGDGKLVTWSDYWCSSVEPCPFLIQVFSGRPTGDRKVVDDKSAEENGDGDASPKGRRRPRRRPRKLKSKIKLC